MFYSSLYPGLTHILLNLSLSICVVDIITYGILNFIYKLFVIIKYNCNWVLLITLFPKFANSGNFFEYLL